MKKKSRKRLKKKAKKSDIRIPMNTSVTIDNMIKLSSDNALKEVSKFLNWM